MPVPGTFGNASGLQSIGAGARKIPQSFLNNIGRNIDKARLVQNTAQVMSVTSAGSHLDIAAIVEDLLSSMGVGKPLPFQVDVISTENGKIKCNIAEGRIFGRTHWIKGTAYDPDVDGDASGNGWSDINENYAGPFSDAAGATKPEPSDKSQDSSTATSSSGTFTGGAYSGPDPKQAAYYARYTQLKPWRNVPLGQSNVYTQVKPWRNVPLGVSNTYSQTKPWRNVPLGQSNVYSQLNQPWRNVPISTVKVGSAKF